MHNINETIYVSLIELIKIIFNKRICKNNKSGYFIRIIIDVNPVI